MMKQLPALLLLTVFVLLTPGCFFQGQESEPDLPRTPVVWPTRDDWTVGISKPRRPWQAHYVHLPEGQSLPAGSKWHEDGTLSAMVDGQQRILAVHVRWDLHEGVPRLNNPLAKMSADEIHGLRGIRLEAWADEIGKQMQAANAENVLITVETDWKYESTDPLPPLPPDTRFLRVELNSSERTIDLTSLPSLGELRYFEFDGQSAHEFDVSLLSECKSLESVKIDGPGHTLHHLSWLGKLTELRHLNIANRLERLDDNDLAFLSNLRKLETLDISWCYASDLSVLEELPELKWVNADWTRVDQLPSGEQPNLETLRVHSTPLNDVDVRRFIQSNPRCRVMHRWEDTLKNVIGGANRLTVRQGYGKYAKALIDTQRRDEITEVLDTIKVDDKRSGFHCMCDGTPFLDFYRDDELMATVGMHHGRSLRWNAGWPDDALLTDSSGEQLVNWLAQRGVDGPKGERESR